MTTEFHDTITHIAETASRQGLKLKQCPYVDKQEFDLVREDHRAPGKVNSLPLRLHQIEAFLHGYDAGYTDCQLER
jgi:hypothetical protein